MPIEFQAVVLAGAGNRLYPLTEDNSIPKCLLPIAHKPLLHYLLNWLHQGGITENAKEMKIEMIGMEEYLGTADILRSIKDKLKSDLLIVSADLLTDAPLHHLLDQHRISSSYMTCMFAGKECWDMNIGASTGGKQAPSTSDSLREDESSELIGLSDGNKMIFVAALADLDESIDFKVKTLFRFPKITVRTDLKDCHCYVLKRSALDFLLEKKSFYSVKSDFIPYLVKKAMRENNPCSVFICERGMCARINTINIFMESNRTMTRQLPSNIPKMAANAEIHAKSQIGNDSLIGEHSKIDDKTSVKKTIIGSNCKIGMSVKLSNCVIMDNVIIEDNAKLESCVVCPKAFIGEKSNLSHCQVGAGFTVQRETIAKNENLTEND